MMPPVKPDTPLYAHGFARRLLAARTARELSQTALGERAGISHTQVSNLEAERHRARVQVADDLSARQYRNGGVDRMARIAVRPE